MALNKPRGYFGISLYRSGKLANWGGILRAGYNFDAAFFSTIENRYNRQPADTLDVAKHIPIFHYLDIESWYESLPADCYIVGIEVNGKYALETFCHPERAVYIFGGENETLPENLWDFPKAMGVKIETNSCLNLVSAATCVLYDRHLKKRRS